MRLLFQIGLVSVGGRATRGQGRWAVGGVDTHRDGLRGVVADAVFAPEDRAVGGVDDVVVGVAFIALDGDDNRPCSADVVGVAGQGEVDQRSDDGLYGFRS